MASTTFSFTPSGRVRTGQTGYAYVFDSLSGQSYIFLRIFGIGAQSRVQLVANTSTREVAVRKASKRKLPIGAAGLAGIPPDREVRILDHLNALRGRPVNPVGPVTPRWTTCLSHENPVSTPAGTVTEPVCTRVSYWKLCNGETLADWGRLWTEDPVLARLPFPVSVIARCIAQVSETLHFMYNAGAEAVYHCDLHLGNVLLHFDPGQADRLPDFHVGDFGYARTAGEAQNDSLLLYGTRGSLSELSSRNGQMPGLGPLSSLAPGTAPPGERRPWDMSRFVACLESLARLAGPAKGAAASKQALGLQGLMAVVKYLDVQERLLACRNPNSRPTTLLEVIQQAKVLEHNALTLEQGTEPFERFVRIGWEKAERLTLGVSPFVLNGDAAQADRYAQAAIVDGPWRLVRSE